MKLVLASAGGPQTQLADQWPRPQTWDAVNSVSRTAPVRVQSKAALQIDVLFKHQQLQAFRILNFDRFRKLDGYLQAQAVAHTINPASVDLFKRAVYEILSTLGVSFGVPDACPGPDGQMIYYWKRPSDSIQVDVKEDGSAEFFYRNRASRDEVFVEYHVGNFSSEVSRFSDAIRLIG